MSETRALTWLRIASVTTLVLIVVASLEARALQDTRHELQQLREERDRAKAGVADAWSRQSADEFATAAEYLNAFYAEPTEGFGRPGGLCAGGKLDAAPIATWVLGPFLRARVSGRPLDAAIGVMHDEIVNTDAYRTVHPPK